MPPDRAKATHEGVRCILVLDALNQLDDQDHARMLGEHTRPDLMVMSPPVPTPCLDMWTCVCTARTVREVGLA